MIAVCMELGCHSSVIQFLRDSEAISGTVMVQKLVIDSVWRPKDGSTPSWDVKDPKFDMTQCLW